MRSEKFQIINHLKKTWATYARTMFLAFSAPAPKMFDFFSDDRFDFGSDLFTALHS